MLSTEGGLVHLRNFGVVDLVGVVDAAHPHKHGMVAARSHVGSRAMVLDHDEAGVPCALRHRCTRTECTVACSCCDGGNSADTRLHTSTPRALRRPHVSVPRDSKTTRMRKEAPCATRPHPIALYALFLTPAATAALLPQPNITRGAFARLTRADA